jgi:hypothetical protein
MKWRRVAVTAGLAVPPAAAFAVALLARPTAAPKPAGVQASQPQADAAVPGGISATHRPAPIPPQTTLAAPKSLDQVGVPASSRAV